MLLRDGLKQISPLDFDGKPLPAPKQCMHSAVLNVESTVAFIQDVDDEALIAKREVLLKVVCGECGVPVEVAKQGRAPRDGSLGAVFELTPQAGR